jgi:fibronectin type 3 domain-containing protein
MKINRKDAKNAKRGMELFCPSLRVLRLCGCWLAFLSAGCAKISEPQPPEIRIPRPAADLAVRQLSDYVVLSFSKPETNTDGSGASTPKSVEVFRMIEDNGPLPEDQFLEKALRIMSIPAARFPEYLKDRLFVVPDRFTTDQSAIYAHLYRYAVLFINNKNQNAGLSNHVSIAPVPIPLAPEGLAFNQTENAITLRWEAPSENMDTSKPARIAGYNVYRSEDVKNFPSSPINPDPVQAPEFEDTAVRFDATYFYAITTIGTMTKPFPESLPSKALRVESRDGFAPAPPEDFRAILDGDIVTLVWSSSPSADTAGYRVYRQEKGHSDPQPIYSELIRGIGSRDSRIEPGKQYEYIIRAVDTHGNEGPAVKAEVEQR